MSGLEDLQNELAKARSLGKWVKAQNPSIMGVRPPQPRTKHQGPVTTEFDVPIPLRDGVVVRGNIHRPTARLDDRLPVIFNYSLYGKDGGVDISFFPPSSGLDKARVTDEYLFEAADPGWWCLQGFVVVAIDARGSFQSDGDKSYYSRDVGIDGYDLVEWLAEQAWSNGKVAMYGASGYAMVQWLVAAEQPPHLSAILPIDGMTDLYREMARKGGILETQFMKVYPTMYNWGYNEVEDPMDGSDNHPYFDEYWQSKIPRLERIRCPAYIVCSWGDNGIHTRGTLNAYKEISSRVNDVYLEIHQLQKWEMAATEESLLRQKAFLDTFLLDRETEVKFWPKVRWTMREAYYVGEWRQATNFPIPGTQYRSFYPTASGGLSTIPQKRSQQLQYDAKDGELEFQLPLTTSFEFAGHAKLRLWVELKGAENADLHITLRKTNSKGEEVQFPWLTVNDNGPIAFGWLKVSRRELDLEKSTEHIPYHKHERDILVPAGQVVPVDIEIQPTSCRFRPGDRLRLVISGHDYGTYPPGLPVARHTNAVNVGSHVIHFGGEYDTFLQLPVIPPVAGSMLETAPPIKMTLAATRFPGWSDDKALHELTGVHAGMTLGMSKVVPMLRGYTQTVAIPQLNISGPNSFKTTTPDGVDWDWAITLTWSTLKGLWGCFQAPEYNAAAGSHVFADESKNVGILSSAYKELMFDPRAFEQRDISKSVVANILLAKSATYTSGGDPVALDERARAVQDFVQGSDVLRYVLNKENVPEDTAEFFKDTPFFTTDWHTIGAHEQWYFSSEEAAKRFLEDSQKQAAMSILPAAFDIAQSVLVVGKENVVVNKDVMS